MRCMNWVLLASIIVTWGGGVDVPTSLVPGAGKVPPHRCDLRGTAVPTSLLPEGTGVSTSLSPVPSLPGVLEEGQVSSFVYSSWDRYFSLLDYLKESFGALSCGDLRVVRKTECALSWSLEWRQLPLPHVAHMLGTRLCSSH